MHRASVTAIEGSESLLVPLTQPCSQLRVGRNRCLGCCLSWLIFSAPRADSRPSRERAPTVDAAHFVYHRAGIVRAPSSVGPTLTRLDRSSCVGRRGPRHRFPSSSEIVMSLRAAGPSIFALRASLWARPYRRAGSLRGRWITKRRGPHRLPSGRLLVPERHPHAGWQTAAALPPATSSRGPTPPWW